VLKIFVEYHISHARKEFICGELKKGISPSGTHKVQAKAVIRLPTHPQLAETTIFYQFSKISTLPWTASGGLHDVTQNSVENVGKQ